MCSTLRILCVTPACKPTSSHIKRAHGLQEKTVTCPSGTDASLSGNARVLGRNGANFFFIILNCSMPDTIVPFSLIQGQGEAAKGAGQKSFRFQALLGQEGRGKGQMGSLPGVRVC